MAARRRLRLPLWAKLLIIAGIIIGSIIGYTMHNSREFEVPEYVKEDPRVVGIGYVNGAPAVILNDGKAYILTEEWVKQFRNKTIEYPWELCPDGTSLYVPLPPNEWGYNLTEIVEKFFATAKPEMLKALNMTGDESVLYINGTWYPYLMITEASKTNPEYHWWGLTVYFYFDMINVVIICPKYLTWGQIMENVTEKLFMGHSPDEVYLICAFWSGDELLYADFIPWVFVSNVTTGAREWQHFSLGCTGLDKDVIYMHDYALRNANNVPFTEAIIIIDKDGNVLYANIYMFGETEIVKEFLQGNMTSGWKW
ncbi:MAG: hypothetical protein ACTSXX_06465 [Candidatus Baldrarchaeia archaeon]